METEITEQERKAILDYVREASDIRIKAAYKPQCAGDIVTTSALCAWAVNGAAIAYDRLSEIRKPSEPETSNDFMQKLQEYFENTPREDILKAWDSTKRFDAEPIGRTDEELVQKIAGIIESDLLNSYVPNFYDEDGDSLQLKDFLSHTDTIYSGIENIHSLVDGMEAPYEIAKLILSSRCQEKPDFPLWIYQNGWIFDTDNGDWLNLETMTFADNVTLFGIYFKAISNVEKQMNV